MRKFFRTLLTLVFLAIFVFSLWKIVTILLEYQAGESHYSNLENYVSFETVPHQVQQSTGEESIPPEDADIDFGVESVVQDDTRWPNVDFDSLTIINPDIVAWLYIEDTVINYPIVQAPNNEYYLNHQFDRSYSKVGCIFLDKSNDPLFTDFNSIIHGHHMKNGSMFASLTEYKTQAYYDAHPVGFLVTPTANYKIHFFSGYVSGTFASAWDMEFTDNDFETWIQELIKKSSFRSELVPEADAKVITLSTCTYEFDNARFVLHGFLEEFPVG